MGNGLELATYMRKLCALQCLNSFKSLHSYRIPSYRGIHIDRIVQVRFIFLSSKALNVKMTRSHVVFFDLFLRLPVCIRVYLTCCVYQRKQTDLESARSITKQVWHLSIAPYQYLLEFRTRHLNIHPRLLLLTVKDTDFIQNEAKVWSLLCG